MTKKIVQALITAFIFFCVAFFVAFFLAIKDIDVAILKNHYPHYSGRTKNSINYTFKKKPPREWVKIEKLSEMTKGAFIVSEDWAFYEHYGIDLRQLKVVVEGFFKTGSLSRGASTITQQVAKNLFLSNEKSIFRKLKELYLALKIEAILSKDKILEIYLNIIDLGPEVIGLGQGAKYYFGVSAYQLLVKEAAFLAMLLPNPHRYNTSFKDKTLTPYAQETIDAIGVKMRQAKFLTEEQRVFSFSKKFWWEQSHRATNEVLD